MFVFCSLRTRATIAPSPASGCVTAVNESALPQMSEPAPLTVNVPFEADALPARPTAPTSESVHPAGSVVVTATLSNVAVLVTVVS